MDWFFDAMPQTTQPAAVQKDLQVSYTRQQAQELKQLLSDLSLNVPVFASDLPTMRLLLSVIDWFVEVLEQYRAMDEFSNNFYLSFRVYQHAIAARNRGINATLCLNTMDIAWVLHSEQQDTLFGLLF